MSALIRKGNFWSGVALAVLGAYIVWQAWGWTYMNEEGPGPGFFPRWYGGVMFILALLLVAGAVLQRASGAEPAGVDWSGVRRALTCWVALAICVALLKTLGFIACFALLTYFIVAVLFRRPRLHALAVAVVGAIGFYALFGWGLDLQLPAGLLF